MRDTTQSTLLGRPHDEHITSSTLFLIQRFLSPVLQPCPAEEATDSAATVTIPPNVTG